MPDTEHSRILIAMARFVGAGFCAYLLTSIPLLGQPAGLVDDWFTPVGVVVAFGPGIVLLMVTFVPSMQAFIPAAAMACAAGFLLACVLWFAAWSGEDYNVETVTWLMAFAGLPSLAWVLVRPVREALIVLIVCGVVAAVITDLGRSDLIESNVIIESAWGVVFTLSFMLASGRVVRTGRLLDQTRESAVEASGRAAAVAARNTERARFDALIHDQVIATLVSAYNNPDEPRLPQQATRALAELQVISDNESGPVADSEAVARVRAAVSAVDADIAVVTRRDRPDVNAVYPLAAVRALTEAVGEAVRNSLGHAGASAECAVLIDSGETFLRVTVADDGVGFDPAAVPPERLGIEVSIRRRLAEVPGMQMRLRSAPGDGTTVQMGWEQ